MTESKDTQIFTLEQVSQHKSDKDCWIVIHGKVYNVSKYLDDHPGGPEIILDISGADVTEDFEDTGHSEDARNTLKTLYIGELSEKDKKVSGSSGAVSSGDGGSTGVNYTLILIVLAVIAAVVGVVMSQFQEEVMEIINGLQK